MQIADLYVNLGIKGQDKTVGALTKVETNLKDVASMSLEAKAAIIGAMYALEQLFAKSGSAGTSLSNFSAITGVSVKTLQQYQYAARQIGVSNEETEGTFKSLISTMSKLRLGEGAPKGLGQVAMLTGGMTTKDIDKFMTNPELLLQKLQVYAQKEKRLGIRNEALKSFGIGDNVIAALSKNAFQPNILAKAPVYGDKEVQSLARADATWRNLGNTISMAVGHLNAAHGDELAKDFGLLVDIGLQFADVILTIAEKFHLFELLDEGFKKVAKGADTAIVSVTNLGNAIADSGAKNKVFDTVGATFDKIEDLVKGVIPLFLQVGVEIGKIFENSKLFEHVSNIFSDIIDVLTKFESILVKVGGAVLDVADEFKIFEKIGNVISTLLNLMEYALGGISSVLDKVNSAIDAFSAPKEKEKMKAEAKMKADATNFLSNLPGLFTNLIGKPSEAESPAKHPTSATKPSEAESPAKHPTPATKVSIPSSAPLSSSKEVSPSPLASNVPVNETESILSVLSSIPGFDVSKTTVFEPKGPVIAPNLKLITPNSPALSEVNKWTPRVSAGVANKNSTQNLNLNQNISIPAGSSPKQTGETIQKAVTEAFRQLPSQVQGS